MAKVKKASTPNKLNTEKDVKVTIAKITALQAILVALISVIGGGLTGYFSYLVTAKNAPDEKAVVVVPESPDVKIVDDIGESGGDGIQLLKKTSIFDLRGWRQVPQSEINNRYSPVNYINYLHVKKTKQTKFYRGHYATSGLAIDLRCLSHTFTIAEQRTPIEHSGIKMKEYAIEINVESMPINEEFLIVVEGTYWNSFQNLEREDVSTYTDTEIEQLNELVLVVLLPESKPFKNYRLWYNPSVSQNKEVYGGSSKFYADKDGKFLYWNIADRKKKYHYSVSWDW